MLTTSHLGESQALERFAKGLQATADTPAALAAGLIGKTASVDGPFGPRPLLYADYVASGRALRQVEDFILESVLPYYANSHTESSFCGGRTTRMREAARHVILDACHGNPRDHAVVFTGSGATSALNILVHLLGVTQRIAQSGAVHVLIGPYEHHSNILPWRESGAMVTEIRENPTGRLDHAHLERVLSRIDRNTLVIAAFSAASNVTGVCTDVGPVTRLVKQFGGKIVWDYAGGAPYLPIDLAPQGLQIDAIALSPHKFIGGPGASGVLLVRRDAVVTQRPSQPGGGTVAFVNATCHDYRTRIEDREEGGTPNAIGDIRAALAMIVKDAIGTEFIAHRNHAFAHRAFAAWADHPTLRILGPTRRNRLPIFSFVLETTDGAVFDYQLFTRALSDLYGIQARGGCACAGPYVHRLLAIDDAWSAQLRARILAGDESQKPGFVRLNFSVLMSDAEVDFILNSVMDLAARYPTLADAYAAQTRLEAG